MSVDILTLDLQLKAELSMIGLLHIPRSKKKSALRALSNLKTLGF